MFTWGKKGPHLGYELPDDVTKQLRPKKVDSLGDHRIINASCGESHTLGKYYNERNKKLFKEIVIPPACSESGKVFVFGRNKYGELGLGNSSSQAVTIPTPIHGLTGVDKVACGLYHSAAIDSEL